MNGLRGYQFEPKYTREERDQERERRKNLDDKLIEFSGRSKNLDWCMCSKCKIMAEDCQCFCCSHSDVISEHRGDFECITEKPQFQNLILDVESLGILRYRKLNKGKKHYNGEENSMWRYLAYTNFINWIRSCTATRKQKKKLPRLVIPSCVVMAIRDRFPERTGNYVGFKCAKGVDMPSYPA